MDIVLGFEIALVSQVIVSKIIMDSMMALGYQILRGTAKNLRKVSKGFAALY